MRPSTPPYQRPPTLVAPFTSPLFLPDIDFTHFLNPWLLFCNVREGQVKFATAPALACSYPHQIIKYCFVNHMTNCENFAVCQHFSLMPLTKSASCIFLRECTLSLCWRGQTSTYGSWWGHVVLTPDTCKSQEVLWKSSSEPFCLQIFSINKSTWVQSS